MLGPGLNSDSEEEDGDSPSANGMGAVGSSPAQQAQAQPLSTGRGRLKRLREPDGAPEEPQPGLDDLFGEPGDDEVRIGGVDDEPDARPMKRRNADLFGDSDEDE